MVSPLQGRAARAGPSHSGQLAVALMDPKPSAGAGATSKTYKEEQTVNSIMGRNNAKRQKCLFSASFMVSRYEFGWHCFRWTPDNSVSVLQYIHSNTHLNELAVQVMVVSHFKLFSIPGCFFANGNI